LGDRRGYITPDLFRRRLEILARLTYNVLPLDDALKRLWQGSLPSRSVSITFDDGFYDFYHSAVPMLREFGFPATVYQNTAYADRPFPVFTLALDYVFWRGSGQQLNGAAYGVPGIFSLSSQEGARCTPS
jgi:Polysaccharide deacetylase